MGGFVDDWRQAWKWFSVQGAAFLAIAPEIYAQAKDLQEYIQPNVFHHMMAALGVSVLIGRLVRQDKRTDPEATQPGPK